MIEDLGIRIAREVAPHVNAVQVMCALRLEHRTLNHLSRDDFRDIALEVSRDSEEDARELCESYGMLDAYEEEAKRIAAIAPNTKWAIECLDDDIDAPAAWEKASSQMHSLDAAMKQAIALERQLPHYRVRIVPAQVPEHELTR